MYLRDRSKVDQATKVPSRPLPSRPEHSTLSKSARQSERALGAEEEIDPVLGIEGVYIISVAARILEMHPQTLRKYERLGLINPRRTMGMLRLYSREDIRKVQLIRRLSDMGLNLAGIEFALGTADNLQLLNRRLQALTEDDESKDAIEAEINALLRSLRLSIED